MPGVTVEDEVGRLMMRGYQLVARSDNEAVLTSPPRRRAGTTSLLALGLLLGIAGVVFGLLQAQSVVLWVGVGVIALSAVLLWWSRRPSGVRVYLDNSGRVLHRRVRGSHW